MSQERREWLDSIEWLLADRDPSEVRVLMDSVFRHYRASGGLGYFTQSHYTNSGFLADWSLPEGYERANALIRWNAVAMVIQAGKIASELGGHLGTYASAATLYDVGLGHFFQAGLADAQDCIYFQGHASPGIYARAFLEGRLQVQDLQRFRQEAGEAGLSSYPHPRLMPDFWSFPTVSMGLGPIMAIYQARFDRYMLARGLTRNHARMVWAFLGDGEMDEPESLGAIGVAARERLDNLVFVINCNLQRLDGPVRGNGKIIQELERMFAGAGWRVIKLVWNQAWLEVIEKDPTGELLGVLDEMVDGEYQAISVAGPMAIRERVFGRSAALKRYADALDADLWQRLAEGGHDPVLVHGAFASAKKRSGEPVVMLVHSVKGYGLGEQIAATNTVHQHKKLKEEDLCDLAQRLGIPEEYAAKAAFYHPGEQDEGVAYLKAQRRELGGYLPSRQVNYTPLQVPTLEVLAPLLQGQEREVSTTMALVRLLNLLLRQPDLKERIVPIVPDESRTFGMEGLFRQIGIYAAEGQKYEPTDKAQIMYYRETKNGQFLQEGLNEAGAISTWIAASCAYANSGQCMLPFYVYYSMFGFQRVGDLIWAAADARARGFLIGATAGRTTLAGEGLQHNDGHSHVLASVVPSCVAYDPAYAYELAVITQEGMRRMLEVGEDVFYYITVMNENYAMPAMPEGAEEGILRGLYVLEQEASPDLQLMGSGTILLGVRQAANWLRQQGYKVRVFSATSFTELARSEQKAKRAALLVGKAYEAGYLAQLLDDCAPVVAATDYLRQLPEMIRAFVKAPYETLGTDGYGRSDTRLRLRDFHEVSWQWVAYTALSALSRQGKLAEDQLRFYRQQLSIDPHKPCPVSEGVTQ